MPVSSPVMDSDNQIKDSAKSYWSAAADGGDVEKGGVGQVLLDRTSARNIYTYLGTNADLKDSSNLFSVSNSSITPGRLGLIGSDTAGRDKLINFIHGFDAYDENGNRIVTEKRDWILGSFIHSRPVVIHYGTTRSVIYAGANDGMLHAFDDATGEELWAFIPPNLLPDLKDLNGEVLEFFVDGSPKAYIGTRQDHFDVRVEKRRGSLHCSGYIRSFFAEIYVGDQPFHDWIPGTRADVEYPSAWEE